MSDKDLLIQAIKDNAVESSIKRYARQNEPEPYYGVAMGTLTKLAKPYLKNNDLAQDLWETGILDAQLLAVQIVDPKTISAEVLTSWCDPKVSTMVLDKLATKVIALRKDASEFEEKLLASDNLIQQKMGWALTIRRVAKGKMKDEELTELFEKIRQTLPEAQEPLKWTVNHCLCEIGIQYDEWTDRCVEYGRENGAYADMKVSPGCTSAFAPEWIAAARCNRDKRKKS